MTETPTPDASPPGAAKPRTEGDYQRLLARFDRLWESASSPQDQREMQELLALINQHEASRYTEHSSYAAERSAA